MVNEDLNKALIPATEPVRRGCERQRRRGKGQRSVGPRVKERRGVVRGHGDDEGRRSRRVGDGCEGVRDVGACLEECGGPLPRPLRLNAQKAAEAARDEAQDLANVGYASEGHAGLAKVDGETTQADAGGVITVKDVAIGGNLEDLASARGQIGDANTVMAPDYNQLIVSGNYYCVQGDSVNGPPTPAHYMLFVDSRDVSAQ